MHVPNLIRTPLSGVPYDKLGAEQVPLSTQQVPLLTLPTPHPDPHPHARRWKDDDDVGLHHLVPSSSPCEPLIVPLSPDS